MKLDPITSLMLVIQDLRRHGLHVMADFADKKLAELLEMERMEQELKELAS